MNSQDENIKKVNWEKIALVYNSASDEFEKSTVIDKGILEFDKNGHQIVLNSQTYPNRKMEFDERGNIVNLSRSFDGEDGLWYDWNFHYQYDSSNRILRCTYCNSASPGPFFPQHQIGKWEETYSYDESGKTLSYDYVNDSDPKMCDDYVPDIHKEYEYDNLGHCILEETFLEKIVREYTDDRILREIKYRKVFINERECNWEEEELTTYQYINDNVRIVKVQDSSGNTKIMKQYFNDDKGQLVKTEFYSDDELYRTEEYTWLESESFITMVADKLNPDESFQAVLS